MSESGIGRQPHDPVEHESDRIGTGWAYLSDLAEVNPRSPSPTDGEMVSFVAMADVSESGVIDNVELREASSGYTPFAVGDVLVAKITPCFENGKGAHVRGLPTRCGLGSTEFHVLRSRSTTSDRYLYHLTRTSRFRLQGVGLMSGSAGQRRVPTEFFGRYAVRMPPLKEQRRIAEVLDTIDETIQTTERVIAKLTTTRIGLMRESLAPGMSVSPPPGWRVMQVRDLLGYRKPAMRSGPFGSTLLSSELVDEGIPLLGIDNVQRESFIKDYCRFVTRAKAHDLRRYRVFPGDIMITIMGTVGRCCVVPATVGEAISSKHVWTLTLDSQKYVPELACIQMNYSPWALAHFHRDEQGGIMSAIRSETLRSLHLPTPPMAKQQEIWAVLHEATCRIEVEAEVLRKLRAARSGFAADLLSGRVRVVAA